MADTLIARDGSGGSDPLGLAVHADDLTPWEMTALESRADVDSLEALQHERRMLVHQIAPLKALHGSFGLWDAKRQQMSRAMQVKARLLLIQAGVKPTDKQVEAEALASEQYEQFVDDSLAARISYIEMQDAIDAIEERIRSREIALQAYNGEMRMAR